MVGFCPSCARRKQAVEEKIQTRERRGQAFQEWQEIREAEAARAAENEPADKENSAASGRPRLVRQLTGLLGIRPRKPTLSDTANSGPKVIPGEVVQHDTITFPDLPEQGVPRTHELPAGETSRPAAIDQPVLLTDLVPGRRIGNGVLTPLYSAYTPGAEINIDRRGQTGSPESTSDLPDFSKINSANRDSLFLLKESGEKGKTGRLDRSDPLLPKLADPNSLPSASFFPQWQTRYDAGHDTPETFEEPRVKNGKAGGSGGEAEPGQVTEGSNNASEAEMTDAEDEKEATHDDRELLPSRQNSGRERHPDQRHLHALQYPADVARAMAAAMAETERRRSSSVIAVVDEPLPVRGRRRLRRVPGRENLRRMSTEHPERDVV